MAEFCGSKVEEVKVTKIVEEKRHNFSFSDDEVATLMWVLNRVGGDPERTPRNHISNIYNAIYKAGVKTLCWPAHRDYNSLYFADRT